MQRKKARRHPNLHQYLVLRLGEPKHIHVFAFNWFAKPLCASSFSIFWRYWNPVYGWLLLYYVYRPLRRYLARPIAFYLTFLASGFLLHDLPFSMSADLYRGHLQVPAVTILFAIFGAFALINEKLGIDLSGRPVWWRVLVNLCWLGAGYWLRNALVALLAHS